MVASENGMRKTSTYKHLDNRPNRTTPGLIAWSGIVVREYFNLSDVYSETKTHAHCINIGYFLPL